MKDIWNELLEFESKDLIQDYFKVRHNSDVNDWKIQEVTSNFIQGREYFRSAKEASIIVRPLLLYYGVACLSRALVLILNPRLRETSLKASHGLEIKNWSEILSSKRFEKIEITITRGGFSELVTATENLNYYRVSTSAINYKSHLTPPPSGYKLSLENAFQFLPDLKKEYKVWTGSQLPFAQLAHNGLKINDGKVILTIYSNEVTDILIDTIFPIDYCKERTVDKKAETIEISYNNANWSPNFTQKWYGALDIGDLCIVPVLPGDIGFNLLSSMYIISYTFGMMARYFPSSWISLGRVQKGDKIFPLINKSLKVIEEKYPETILDFLRAPYHFETST